MYEQFNRNRAALAKRMGVPEKILPEHVKIAALTFFKGAEKIATIQCSTRNTGGMLFFEEQFTTAIGLYHSRNLTDAFLRVARLHFAEFWDDAEQMQRPIILATKRADRVVATWNNE